MVLPPCPPILLGPNMQSPIHIVAILPPPTSDFSWLLSLQEEQNEGEKLTTRQVIIRQTENFLTNPILEALRKADQLDADFPDDDARRETTKVLLLVPIIEIENEMVKIDKLLGGSIDKTRLELAQRILLEPKYGSKVFKKIFNRYSDNIFYTNSKQANLYLAGGTTPSSQQTTQYLFRNSILTAIEFVQQDIAELLDSIEKNGAVSEQDVQDAASDLADASKALKSYLLLADPEDLAVARQLLNGR